ncbi:MAG TPA: S8 family serine peptidase [Gemmatimonadota bacterium]
MPAHVPLDAPHPPRHRATAAAPGYTGHVVLALQQGLVDAMEHVAPGRYDSYADLAPLLADPAYDGSEFDAQADLLSAELHDGGIAARRVVGSLTVGQIDEILTGIPPPHPAPTAVALRDPGIAAFWRLDVRGRGDADALVARLKTLYGKVVARAYRERLPAEPAAPQDDLFSPRQGYLERAPLGIDARWAWQHGVEGACSSARPFKLVDLEQGWIEEHEDLPRADVPPAVNDNRHGVVLTGPPRRVYLGHHGTAVLGVVAGADNDRGVIGAAPKAAVATISHYKSADGETYHVAEAIYGALTPGRTVLRPGDVLLVEVQRDELPTEVDEADLIAIATAVQIGVVVVEAAGNGRTDLGSWSPPEQPGSFPLRRESGAILVGAACPRLPHDRWRPSNFGDRVVCYGWGAGVVSAGYGDLNFSGTPLERRYTARFGGTSAAAAIVAGAAMLLQSAADADGGPLLDPAEMRARLADPATGTPQGPHVPGAIGVMPDVRAVTQRLRRDRGNGSSKRA